MSELINYKSGQFFVITFLVTWVCWFAAPLVGDAIASDVTFLGLMIVGLAAPFATALYLTLTSGTAELRQVFFNKLLNIRLIKFRSVLFFLILFPATMIVSILISIVLGGSSAQFAIAEEFSFSIGVAPAILVLVLAAGFEELGWRGYAVESLNEKFNYFWATMIFGLLWSLWHMPMFFIPESYQAELLEEDIWLVINFFLSIVPLAFIISWFCHKNSGSILGAVIIHLFINLAQEFFQVDPYTKCIQTGVLILVAAAFVLADKQVFFGDVHESRPEPA